MTHLILEEEPKKVLSKSEKRELFLKEFRTRLGVSFVLFSKEFFFGLTVSNKDVLSSESLKSNSDAMKPRKGPDRIVSI